MAEESVVNGKHNYSAEDEYVWPEDKKVLEKLEWFRDQKLALMMHWGPYSQLGIVESWALSDKDADWSRDCIDWNVTGEEFKREYFALNKTFNPVRFEPDKWAECAKEAGMKYVIFTTKHHDGFCMFDSQFSDYKITANDCPYHDARYADISHYLFDAFRAKDIGIAAYFSKADWHVDSYWHNNSDCTILQSRGPSYVPKDDPAEWERFVSFTQNQIMELGTKYGPLDIMWFDAGWVCAENGQDIRLGEVIDKVREFQPGMLCCDRTIGGEYENYVTPEQCVPEEPMNIPWESCITLGTSFSFKYEDRYKTPKEVITLLTDIVCKGGNLAINVGPQPDGRLPEGAIRSMQGFGKWLQEYGEAIYGTRPVSPYKKDGIAFTQKAENIYAIKIFDEMCDDQKTLFIPMTEEIEEITALSDPDKNKIRMDRTENGYMLYDIEPADNEIGEVFVLRRKNS